MPENKSLNVDIGIRVRKLRENKGWSREEFSERLGLSLSFVTDLERGRSGGSLETIKLLSDTLDVTTDYILFGNENREDYSNITRHFKELSAEKLEAIESIIRTIIETF